MLARMMVSELLVRYSQACGLECVPAVMHSCCEVCGCSIMLQPHILLDVCFYAVVLMAQLNISG